MATTRRLAAILAADVAGYSRLMEADEEDTHNRLSRHFRQLVAPKIGEHHGHVVKNTGDGVLAEFASVIDALRCATEIQRGMIDRDPEVADDRRIKFRIGINLGDVIAEQGDIFGDGVNVAARLEALAEPGGVCISRTVRDQIRDKFAFHFDDIGEQSVKNIARPIRVYAINPETIASLPATQVSAATPATKSVRPLSIVAVALMGILVVAGVLWWLTPSSREPLGKATAPANEPVQSAKRLSIVVLPFKNLSNDPEQQYFADGITEDLTTDLSRIADSFVISANTAFTYQGKSVDAKQIGRELGVRYVLEGSVQRSGNQVRVNAQLIDAETDAHLWADQFERDIGDLFALQNEITVRIAIAFNVALVNAEAQRQTASPDVMDYIFRGRAEMLRPPSPDSYGKAIAFFEHALAIDPHSVEAQTWLGRALAARVLDGMSTSATADIARAEGLVGQALATSPNSPPAHYAKAQVLRTQNQCDEAILEYETALASDPNWIGALHGLANCKVFTGSIEESVSLAERAIRLSPRDPLIWWAYLQIGRARLLQSRIDEAIVWLEKARNAAPVHPDMRLLLAAAYGLKGETERAAAELAEARRLRGEGSYSSIARMKTGAFGLPKLRALSEATVFAGWRKAGMPEE
jgi:adenylate cyclase